MSRPEGHAGSPLDPDRPWQPARPAPRVPSLPCPASPPTGRTSSPSSPAARCRLPRRRSRRLWPAFAATPPMAAKPRQRSWPPPSPSCTRSSNQSPRTCAACVTSPCSWSGPPARASVYANRVHGVGTRRAYCSAWRAYEARCCSLGHEPLDGNPDTVATYIACPADPGAAGRDGLSMSSLRSPWRRSGPPTAWPAWRSSCAIPGSPWRASASPAPKVAVPS